MSGIALIKAGGASHTCAGQSANLIPDSAYRARAHDGDLRRTRPRACAAASLGAQKFERDDPLYVSTLRTRRAATPRAASLLAQARRRLVGHEQREMAGRLPGRGRL